MLHDGAPALAIAIPSGIRLHERRAARRLPVAAEPQLPTSTARLDETAFRFEITDVSVHGAGGTAHNAPVLMVGDRLERSEEHTSELQSLMRNSYAVFCLKNKKKHKII